MALTIPLLPFALSRQFQQNKEEAIATFKNEGDALASLENSVSRDHKTKMDTTYRLYQDQKIIKEIVSLKQETLESSGSQSSGRSSSFSPLSTSPRPPGTLPHRKQEDDLDD